jgi:hypothetical protein
VAAVFALSPAMRDYLEHDIAPLIQRRGAQQGLVEALQARAQLRLEYDAEFTRTAAQAFDERAGNCLSLVVMSAALARHLNLPVTFQALVGHESWSRSGDLSFVNGHVNITVARRLIDRVGIYGTDALLRMEFGGIEVGRGQALREVSEARILAMFMNNRAAERTLRGQAAQAPGCCRRRHDRPAAWRSNLNTATLARRPKLSRTRRPLRRASTSKSACRCPRGCWACRTTGRAGGASPACARAAPTGGWASARSWGSDDAGAAHARGLAQHDFSALRRCCRVSICSTTSKLSVANMARPSSRLSWMTLTPRRTQASTLASAISMP